MMAGCASTRATLSGLCEKTTIETVARWARSRFSSASAGVVPVFRPSAAKSIPSTSRHAHVATWISSKPTAPSDTLRQRSPSTRHSSTIRRRVARSASRSRSRSMPPSWTHAGSRLSIFVEPAWYG